MVLSLIECILCQSSISLVRGDTNALTCHLASEHKATKEESKAKTKEENKMNKHLTLLLAIHFLTEEEREMVMKMAESRMVRNRIILRRSLASSGESSTCDSPRSCNQSSSNSSSPTPQDSNPLFLTPTSSASTSTPVSTPIILASPPTTTTSPEQFSAASPALFTPPMGLACSARRARYSLDSSVALRVGRLLHLEIDNYVIFRLLCDFCLAKLFLASR